MSLRYFRSILCFIPRRLSEGLEGGSERVRKGKGKREGERKEGRERGRKEGRDGGRRTLIL